MKKPLPREQYQQADNKDGRSLLNDRGEYSVPAAKGKKHRIRNLTEGFPKGLKHQMKHRERPTVWRPIKGMLMQGI